MNPVDCPLNARELAVLYAKLDSYALPDGDVVRYPGSVELDPEELEYLRELIGAELDALERPKKKKRRADPAPTDHPGQTTIEEAEHVATVRLGGGVP